MKETTESSRGIASKTETGQHNPAMPPAQTPASARALGESLRTLPEEKWTQTCADLGRALQLDRRGNRRALLLLNDCPYLREYLLLGIKTWVPELEVLPAASGREALALARHHPIDLLLCDLVRPDEDGLALIQAFRAAHPAVPVVIGSGKAITESELRASGAVAQITFPVPMQELFATLGQWLQLDTTTIYPPPTP
jgi:CheY-like chemotaxis protein